MEKIKNTYIESNQENLDYLLSNGANIGICSISGILTSKFIVVNAYGNLFGFNDVSTKKDLKHLIKE